VRLLADENIPRCIVEWLRAQRHDVLYAAEDRVQTPEVDLLSEAEAQGYVILTEDLDFGELVFRHHLNSHGVILMRMEDSPASIRLLRLQKAWGRKQGRDLY
jgi:predicted nuclease of predicted toxin-antitoxin system